MEQDTLDKVLGAISAVEKKIDEKALVDDRRFDEGSQRFATINVELGKHRADIDELTSRMREAEKNIRDQAALLNSMSHSTARAVDKALDAQRTADQAIDEARKIVESAIKIHSVSMSAALKDAVQPLSDQVDAKIKEAVGEAMSTYEVSIAKAVGEAVGKALQTHNANITSALAAHDKRQAAALEAHAEQQDDVVAKRVEEAMAPVNTKVDTMVSGVDTFLKTATKTVTSRPLRIAIMVVAGVGGLIGSAAFGWYSADELAKAKSSSTPAADAGADVVIH